MYGVESWAFELVIVKEISDFDQSHLSPEKIIPSIASNVTSTLASSKSCKTKS